MIDFQTKKSGHKKILTVKGEMTIQNASALHCILVKTLKNTRHLVLDLENITDIDLSCLQLLCSAHRTTMESKKRFTVNSNCPDIFKKAVEDAGFLQQTGCKPDSNDECFCIKGTLLWPQLQDYTAKKEKGQVSL